MTTFLLPNPLLNNLPGTNYLLWERSEKIDASCAKKMTEAGNKATYPSNFYWLELSNVLFVKFQPKEIKSVSLLSSMHLVPDVDASKEKKPEMILFNNANKIGVDFFDQMASPYTTRSASRRWPAAVWGNSLDIAAFNSYVWAGHTKSCRKPTGQARTFSEQQQ